MDEPKPDFWFPAKRVGWGWGVPVRWQGWALLLAYVGAVIAGIGLLRDSEDSTFRLLYMVVVTVLFIVVVAVKGERPLKWRSGK